MDYHFQWLLLDLMLLTRTHLVLPMMKVVAVKFFWLWQEKLTCIHYLMMH